MFSCCSGDGTVQDRMSCILLLLTYMYVHVYLCYLQIFAHTNITITDVDMGNKSSGTPLLQMLNYSHIQQKQRQLDINIVQFFIDEGAVLSRVLSAGGCDNYTALEMSINLQRFDNSQKLIEKGVDPIDGGDPNMMTIFVEYVQFGTNNFIKWLLEHYQKINCVRFQLLSTVLFPAKFSPLPQ